MEENKEQPKKCDGRCETCNINQRTYCAAQISYYNQQEIAVIKSFLSDFCKRGEEDIILKEKSENIADSEAENETEYIKRETANAEIGE